MFLGISIAVMIGYVMAIMSIPKKERKGIKYIIVVIALSVSVVAVAYNGVLLGKQMGAAQFLAAMRNKAGEAVVGKVAAPITNVGTGAVASA
jgi:hypothetical protein